jgi:hypothetical protein
MAVKVFQPLTTPVGTNEQTGVGQATIAAASTVTYTDRGLPARADRAIFFLDVSAISGTSPSLTVAIQGQDPGSLKWQTIATFPAQTAVTGATTPLAPLTVNPLFYTKVRAQAVVSGTTPSVTFSCGAIFMSDEIAYP